jgi:hypothetical protein
MLKHREFKQSFPRAVRSLNYEQQMELALFCAEDCFHLNISVTKSVAKSCIDLVKHWLSTKKQLLFGIDELKSIVLSVLDEQCSALLSATNAAYAIFNRTNFHSEGHFNGHFHGNVCASFERAREAYEKSSGQESFFNANFRYVAVGGSLLTTTNTKQPFTDLECKLVYLIDDTDEDIVICHDNRFFINMNGIKDCPEYGFSTREELLKTVLESQDLFWQFVRKWLNRLYP